MKKKYIILIILGLGLFWYLYYLSGQILVIADFESLDPFKNSIPVYYKGFKLGHTGRVYPGKDYHTTRVDLILRLQGLKLPSNTKVIVKRKDKKDFIELIYPASPYITYLRNGTIVKGTKGANFESYFQEQTENGGIDEVKDNLNNTIVSVGKSFDSLADMLGVLTDILNDIRPNINDTMINLNVASKNISQTSLSIRKSFDNNHIENTLSNVDKSSKNIQYSTANVNTITRKLNKESVEDINCLINNMNIVVSNINEIVVSIGETLKKRFGGAKLFFGKTIKK